MNNTELLNELRCINNTIDCLEREGRFGDAEAVIQANRWILDYDSDGNWVGVVLHEDGFSA